MNLEQQGEPTPWLVYYIPYMDEMRMRPFWKEHPYHVVCVWAKTGKEASDKCRQICSDVPHVEIKGWGSGKAEWCDEVQPLRTSFGKQDFGGVGVKTGVVG